MDKELEAIVQRMLDAGEAEENIAAVIREWKAPTTQAGPTVETAQLDKTTPPVQETGGVPGVLAGLGGTMLATAEKVRPAIGAAANFVAKSPIAQRAIGSLAGAAAFPLAAPLGPLAVPAAITAYGAGRRYSSKGAKAVAKAAGTGTPQGAAGRFAAPAGRGFFKLLPKLVRAGGWAALAADLGPRWAEAAERIASSGSGIGMHPGGYSRPATFRNLLQHDIELPREDE